MSEATNGHSRADLSAIVVGTEDDGPVARHCPGCGQPWDDRSFTVEYWTTADRVWSCWCSVCGWLGDIAISAKPRGALTVAAMREDDAWDMAAAQLTSSS